MKGVERYADLRSDVYEWSVGFRSYFWFEQYRVDSTKENPTQPEVE